MVDAHCHLYEIDDTDMEMQKYKDAGGTLCICAGAGLESSQKAIEMAEKYENVYATVGIHPEETVNSDEEVLVRMMKNKTVVAIGECGLDYYEKTSEEEKEKQKEVLKLNIKWAKEKNLPLVVHCRNAFDDVFKVVDYPLVQMHCFTGNEEQMKECVTRGWYMSFGGIITFKNDKGLREVMKKVPENLLMTETDAPWLSPEPFRGEKNVPFKVKYVLECMAQTRGDNYDALAEIIESNAKTLFGI